MKFDIDVLIIFSSADNDSSDKKEPGWVSQFKRFLELMLSQVLGEKPNILLKEEFDSMTSPNLDNAAALVSILTKNFIQSGQCLDYLETFFKTSHETPRKINRVFKVFKNPLAIPEQPPRLRELIGYEMYQLDPNSGDIREYSDYFSSEAERQYWMKMVDLAYDIHDTLLQLKGEASLADTRNLYNRKTIYLAETGHDMAVQRNIIKRELQRHGYAVLPNQTLVGNFVDLEKSIQKDLEESNLSIHLIGAAYGEIPEGSNQSIPEFQLSLAAEKIKTAKEANTHFSRLVWISPNMPQVSERQRVFIERIKADLETHEQSEILQMPIEDFKVIVREELLDRHERLAAQKTGVPAIYLIHDRIDHHPIQPFAELIQSNGFQLLLPAFDNDLMTARKKHIDNLRSFDAAIIFGEKVSEQWIRMKALDLLKAPGYGRKKPILGKAIISTGPAKFSEESYKGQSFRVIQGDQQNTLESFKDLLKELIE